MKKEYKARLAKGLVVGIVVLAAGHSAMAQVKQKPEKQAQAKQTYVQDVKLEEVVSDNTDGPPPGPRFSHQTIYVVDLKKSSEFYEKVMQLKQIAEPFHDNRHTWFRISEHGQLHVVGGAKAVIPHDINIHLAFSVPSLEAFMKHLDEMHVKYGDWTGNGKPQARPDKVLQIYLQDPDGYWIEVNNDTF